MRTFVVIVFYFFAWGGVMSIVSAISGDVKDPAYRAGELGGAVAVTLLLLASAEAIDKRRRRKSRLTLPSTAQPAAPASPAPEVATVTDEGRHAPPTAPATVPASAPSVPIEPAATSARPLRERLAAEVATIVVAGAVLAVAWFGYAEPAFRGLVVFSLILFLMLRLAVLRRASPTGKVGAFVVVAACLIVGGSIGQAQHRRQVRQMALEVADQLEYLSQASLDENGLPTTIDAPPNATPTLDGSVGRTEAFVKQWMQKLIARRNAYLKGLDEAGWNTIFDPQRLGNDLDAAESRLIVQRGRNVFLSQKTALEALIQEYDAGLQRLMRISRRSGGQTSRRPAEFTEALALEQQVIDEVGKAVDVLHAARGTWAVQDDQVVFERDEDVQAFNECLENINSIAEQQQALQKTALQRAQENLRSPPDR